MPPNDHTISCSDDGNFLNLDGGVADNSIETLKSCIS